MYIVNKCYITKNSFLPLFLSRVNRDKGVCAASSQMNLRKKLWKRNISLILKQKCRFLGGGGGGGGEGRSEALTWYLCSPSPPFLYFITDRAHSPRGERVRESDLKATKKQTTPPHPQESFIGGGSSPRSQPLTFYMSFSTGKVTLSYTFYTKWYHFHISTVLNTQMTVFPTL